MLKKLASLLLSLLISLSLLPGQAGAMDASENEPPARASGVVNPVSPGDADAGDAPSHAVMAPIDDETGLGGGIGAWETRGNGGTFFGGGGMYNP